MRQIGMFDPSQYEHKTIAIVGLGNIGSHTALALARMGLRNFRLWDFDLVEPHNTSSQVYTLDDDGWTKVGALEKYMQAINPEINLDLKCERCTEEDADIIISAVDTLEARRTLARNSRPESFVIDGRMGGGQLEVYSQRVREWAATIPETASEDPCGMKFISYTSYIMAGLIANQVKRHLKGERLAKRIIMHCDTYERIVTWPEPMKS